MINIGKMYKMTSLFATTSLSVLDRKSSHKMYAYSGSAVPT